MNEFEDIEPKNQKRVISKVKYSGKWREFWFGSDPLDQSFSFSCKGGELEDAIEQADLYEHVLNHGLKGMWLSLERDSSGMNWIIKRISVSPFTDTNDAYQMKMTLRQAQVISTACELFARLRLGQFYDIVWKVFPETMGKTDIDHEVVRSLLERAGFELRNQPSNTGSDKDWSEETRLAWDIHQVLRHQMSWDRHPAGDSMNVHFDKPLPISRETLVQVERVDG